jgi:hypothetical protein
MTHHKFTRATHETRSNNKPMRAALKPMTAVAAEVALMVRRHGEDIVQEGPGGRENLRRAIICCCTP